MEAVGMLTGKTSLVRRFAEQVLETDSYLINQILNDNNKYAAETLIERYYKSVYKTIYLKVSDKEMAMDLTQDTFVSMLKGLGQFDESKAQFKTWLLKIAQNKIIDYTRSRAYKESLFTELMDTYGTSTVAEYDVADDVINRNSREMISELLSEVDDTTRKIFWMKAKDGYTFAEISERTGLKVSKVKATYYALIKELRKEMHDYE